MVTVLHSLCPVAMMLLFSAATFGFTFWYRHHHQARAEQMFATHKLGDLAPRLGLELVQGAPNDNLAVPPSTASMAGRFAGSSYERVVRLTGAPRGREVDIVHGLNRSTDSPFFGPVTTSTRRDAYVGVRIDPRVPSFELASLRSAIGAPSRMLPLPQVCTGRMDLDAEFAFASGGDARLAQMVCEQATRFSSVLRRTAGVHLVCDGGWLRFSIGELHAFSVFAQVEEVVWGLEAIAASLESSYASSGYRDAPRAHAVLGAS